MKQNSEEKKENEKNMWSGNKLPKISAFSLVDMFNKYIIVKVYAGTKYYFDGQKGYFIPLSKNIVETLLLNNYYDWIAMTDSMRVVKTAADIIMRKDYPEMSPTDCKSFVGFKMGCLDLRNLEQLVFNPDLTNSPDIRYRVLTTGFTMGDTWYTVKQQKTAWMDYFLNCIAGNDQKLITRIWQMIGYLLTSDTDGKCFFLLQGVPNSGKTVIGQFLSGLFPTEKISNLDIDQLGKRHATSLLVDKHINISMDLPNKSLSPLAVRNIKLMTGKDDLTVEYANGRYETYHGGCKFLFATNHALTLRGIDEGFTDRIVCIPFQNAIAIENREPHLLQYLMAEANGIACKALAYYRELRYSNYRFAGEYSPQITYLPTEADDTDEHLCQFVEERCSFVSKRYHRTHTSDLYDAYLNFCSEYKYTPVGSIVAFSRKLKKCYGDKIDKQKWRKEDSDDGDISLQNGFLGIILKSEQVGTVVFDV